MPIHINPELETKLRARAEAVGLTVETYIERIASDDQAAEDELTGLAVGGLISGGAMETGPGYWEEKHRRLEERLQKPGAL
jgi:hypothetical protein